MERYFYPSQPLSGEAQDIMLADIAKGLSEVSADLAEAAASIVKACDRYESTPLGKAASTDMGVAALRASAVAVQAKLRRLN